MGFFNIDFSQFKPSIGGSSQPLPNTSLQTFKNPLQLNQTPVSQIPKIESNPGFYSPSSQSNQTPNQSAQGAPAYRPQEGFIQKAFDALAIPSQLVEKGITTATGTQSYEDLAKKIGFQNPITQKILGTTGRLVLDPLNLIPFEKAFGIGGKLASKIPGLAETIDRVGQGINKAGTLARQIPLPSVDITKGVAKVGKTSVGDIVDNLGTKFVSGYKLPEEYNVAKANIPLNYSLQAKDFVQHLQQSMKVLTPKEKEFLPLFLEPHGAGAGQDLGALRQSIGEDRFQNVIRPILRDQSKNFDSQVVDLVQRGRMKGDTAKQLLTQGGYYPHTDFAPESVKQYFQAPKFGEKRGYLNKRQGVEGFTYNAPKAIARRQLSQFQDNAVQDFLRLVKDRFGRPINGETVPDGYKAFINPSGRLQELNGYALPQRIADDLNATFRPAGTLEHIIDTFNGLWKPTATAMNPAFHLMNIEGNLFNSWLGGMKDPRRFLQAIAGGFSPEDRAVLEKSGILDKGQFAVDSVARSFDNPEGINLIHAFDKFRKVGNYFENNARSAFFLDQRAKFLKQGFDDVSATQRAMQKTNEYLFDYLTGLTPFETNVMRRFFPFYTWARFNIPLQFKNIITQPEKAAFISKLYQDLNRGYDLSGDQEGITIPTPFVDANGNPIRIKPNIPIQDIFGLNPQRVISMLNPLIKEPINLATYAGGGQHSLYDTFTGQEITNKSFPVEQQARDIIKNKLQSMLRPVRSFNKAAQEDFSPGGITRQLTGQTYTLNPEKVAANTVFNRNLTRSDIESRMRQIMRDQTLSKDEKDRLLQRYQDYLLQVK